MENPIIYGTVAVVHLHDFNGCTYSAVTSWTWEHDASFKRPVAWNMSPTLLSLRYKQHFPYVLWKKKLDSVITLSIFKYIIEESAFNNDL